MGLKITNNNGDTPQNVAKNSCATGADCSSVVEYLIPLSQFPLHEAAERGNINIVKNLIKENPTSVNSTNNKKETAVYLAAWKGRYEVVKYLVEEAKADAFIKEGNGWTAFHEMAQWGWLDLVKSLVKKNPSAVNIRTNKSGTALDIAENICYEGADCSGVVEYLKTFNSWIHILFKHFQNTKNPSSN